VLAPRRIKCALGKCGAGVTWRITTRGQQAVKGMLTLSVLDPMNDVHVD
jgi:hypothetical protein